MQISTKTRRFVAVTGKGAAGVRPLEAAIFWPASCSAPLYDGVLRTWGMGALKREEAGLIKQGAHRRRGLDALVEVVSQRLYDLDGTGKSYTYCHSPEVATLCYVMFREAVERRLPGTAGTSARAVFGGGYVHDDGKTFLPHALLAKERGVKIGHLRILRGIKLTDVERSALRYCHLAFGSAHAELFKYGSDDQDLAVAIRMIGLHHVAYNGQDTAYLSYPAGVKGADLELYCRIAKTADFISAARPRHYRPHYQTEWVHSLRHAVAYAIAVAGRELDPLTVSCLITGMYDIKPDAADRMVGRLRYNGEEKDIADSPIMRSYVQQWVLADGEFATLEKAHGKMNKYTGEIAGLGFGGKRHIRARFPE